MKTREERKADRNILAMDLTKLLESKAQKNFVKWVAKEKKIDFYQALLICQGHSDPIEWEYTLGYKMSNPVYMIAMNMQKKANREKAMENFKKELTPEELAIFESEVQTKSMRTKFRSELGKAKK